MLSDARYPGLECLCRGGGEIGAVLVQGGEGKDNPAMELLFWGRAVCCNGFTVSALAFLTAGSGARRPRPRSNIAVYCPDGDLGDSEPGDFLRPNCGLVGKLKRFDCTGDCSWTFTYVGAGKRRPEEILRPRGG